MRLFFVVIFILLAGCLNDEHGSDIAGVAVGDSTAAAPLLAAGRSHIDRAMADLRDFQYLRDRSVTVADEAGVLLARHAHRTRFSGPPDDRIAEIMDTSSGGSGSATFWKEYAASAAQEDTLEWSLRLLPGDPLVLSQQGPSYYHYTALGDTVVSGASVARIVAQLMTDSDRQGIQTGTFYVDREADELVGFDLLFVHRSLLFDEESRFRYLLQPGPGGGWLPLEVDVNTLLDLPLSKGQRFALKAKFTNPVPEDLP